MMRENLLERARTLMAETGAPSIAYGYLGPLIISKKLFEVALIIRANQKKELLAASARRLLKNSLVYIDQNERVLAEISALNLTIQLPKTERYPRKAKSFEPDADHELCIALIAKNIPAWQTVIRMYIQQHPTISDTGLSAGEIVALYFKLQDRRRMEEKD
jgi:hypothetical protein